VTINAINVLKIRAALVTLFECSREAGWRGGDRGETDAEALAALAGLGLVGNTLSQGASAELTASEWHRALPDRLLNEVFEPICNALELDAADVLAPCFEAC
jgi:hypothetical protein